MTSLRKRKDEKIAEKQKEFGRKPIYDAFYKTKKTVESCITTKQLDSAYEMVQQFDELYGDYQFTRSILKTVSNKAIELLNGAN